MTETFYAGKMPILALRGLAVFPEQTVHFDVGRKKSVLALEAAMKADPVDYRKMEAYNKAFADRVAITRGEVTA